MTLEPLQLLRSEQIAETDSYRRAWRLIDVIEWLVKWGDLDRERRSERPARRSARSAACEEHIGHLLVQVARDRVSFQAPAPGFPQSWLWGAVSWADAGWLTVRLSGW